MADSFLPQTELLVFEEGIVLTLTELCHASGADEAQVLALVGEGVLAPNGSGPKDWMFDGLSLQTARMALRLARDFELGVPGIAMVLELRAEIITLRTRLSLVGVR